MVSAILTSLVMAVVYVAAVIIKDKELPDSISALVYKLPRKWQWVWSVWLLVCGGTACIGLIDMLPENTKFVGFLSLACIGFTAVMPLVYDEFRDAHNILGVSAGILTQVAVLLVDRWWLLAWPIGIALLSVLFLNESVEKVVKGKFVLLSEIFCAFTVYGALLL